MFANRLGWMPTILTLLLQHNTMHISHNKRNNFKMFVYGENRNDQTGNNFLWFVLKIYAFFKMLHSMSHMHSHFIYILHASEYFQPPTLKFPKFLFFSLSSEKNLFVCVRQSSPRPSSFFCINLILFFHHENLMTTHEHFHPLTFSNYKLCVSDKFYEQKNPSSYVI